MSDLTQMKMSSASQSISRTCTIEAVRAVHANDVQWLLSHEPVHQLHKGVRLLGGGRLAVATALHLVVLGALHLHLAPIIKARRVG